MQTSENNNSYGCGYRAYYRDSMAGIMNVTRVTQYIEAISQWTGIVLCVLAFKYLPISTAWIFLMGYVVLHIGLCVELSKFDDRYLGKQQVVQGRADKANAQVNDFVHDYTSDNSDITIEKFEETKSLLMADWLDANPGLTRMDFQKHFDRQLQLAINSSLHPYPEELKHKTQ